MSKWFEVKVVNVTFIAVEVGDGECEDDAIEVARDEMMDVTEIECTGERTTPDQIDSLKRHADMILKLDTES